MIKNINNREQSKVYLANYREYVTKYLSQLIIRGALEAPDSWPLGSTYHLAVVSRCRS